MNFSNVDNDMNFIMQQHGKDIQINNSNARALISSVAVNENYDDKKIVCMMPLNRGNVITYKGNDYLIISEVASERYNYYKAIMRNCNYNIKFNFNGTVMEFPAIIESKVVDIETGQYFTMPEGKISVILQDNGDTREIALQQRFIKMGNAYNVTGIDRTQVGLIKLTCEIVAFNANDDRENEIADRWLHETQHNYVVSITNGDSITIEEGSTLQLDILVTDNGNVVSMPVIYSSSDETIATVDTNGLITAIAQGDCVIQVALQEDNSINDTISITVEQVQVVDNYSITITGADSITIGGNTETYTAKVYNNSVLVNDKTVTWSIDNTTLATIQSSTGNSCIVVSNDNWEIGSIVISAILVDDNSVTASKNIDILSLF